MKSKTPFEKWWLWLLATLFFLVFVHTIFTIKAPYKWMEATWEAGDLLSLVGTLVLGYVAILQTQRANDIAKNANDTSVKLIELQKAEYTPIITISDFIGLTYFDVSKANIETTSEIFIHVMRTKEGEAYVGLSVSLVDEQCNLSEKIYCRSYEIHFNYDGRFVIENFTLDKISFVGNNFNKCFIINNDMGMSLGNQTAFTLFLFLLSNEDFTQNKSLSHQYLSANRIILDLKMMSIVGKVYQEQITIRKILVDNPSPNLSSGNAEMLVSASYKLS